MSSNNNTVNNNNNTNNNVANVVKPAAAAAAAVQPMKGLELDDAADRPVFLLAGAEMEFKASTQGIAQPMADNEAKAAAKDAKPASAAASGNSDTKADAKASETAHRIDEKMAKATSQSSMALYNKFFAKGLMYRVEDREHTDSNTGITKKYPTFRCSSRKELLRLGGSLFKTALEQDKSEDELFLGGAMPQALSHLIHFVETYKERVEPGVPLQPLRSKKFNEIWLKENPTLEKMLADKKAAIAAASKSVDGDKDKDNKTTTTTASGASSSSSSSSSATEIGASSSSAAPMTDDKVAAATSANASATVAAASEAAAAARGKGTDTDIIAFFKSILTFTDDDGKKKLFHGALYNFALLLNYVDNRTLLYNALAMVAARIKGHPVEKIPTLLTTPYAYSELQFGADDPDYALSADAAAASAAYAAATAASTAPAPASAAASSSSSSTVAAMSD